MADEPLLVMSGITKRFGAVEALVDVEFDASAGEVVALVGDNGAGKSTLVKAVAGAQPADTGEIRFDGQPVSITTPHDAQNLGIATVYQDLALCENLDVVANLYLGREAIAGTRIIDEVSMEGRTRALLDELAVRTLRSVRTQVASLSGGQRQTVAIARAMLGEPRLVLLDEPTAALGVAQTAQVLELIHRLRARGMAVVVISHNLADVFQVADRIVVLRLGRNAGDYPADAVSQDDVVAAITGAGLSADGEQPSGGHA
jgi:D-xylose transport system ATP-binding protein